MIKHDSGRKRINMRGENDEPGVCPICDGVGCKHSRDKYTGEIRLGSCWACDGTGLNRAARNKIALERAEREQERIDKQVQNGVYGD